MLAKKGKKVLAMLLTLCMVLGLLPMSALASSNDQIGSYYELDQNGNMVGEGTATSVTTTDDGAVTLEKNIKPLAGENEFEITLKVTTTPQTKVVTTSPDAAVVITIDVSNSMDSKDIKNAKAAAKAFVKNFIAEAGTAKRMVSIVAFGSNAVTVLPWTDANSNGTVNPDVNAAIDRVSRSFVRRVGEGACNIQGKHTHDEAYSFVERAEQSDIRDEASKNGPSSSTCKVCGATVKRESQWILVGTIYYWKDHDHCTYDGCATPKDTNHRHDAPKEYSGPHGGSSVTPGGGTNMQGGLRLTDNLLRELKGREAFAGMNNLFTVMLTDGAPSDYSTSKQLTGSVEYIEGGNDGSNLKDEYKTYAATEAGAIRNNTGAKLYTISYGTSDKVNNWLSGSIATKNYPADKAGDLNLVFEAISQQILLEVEAWRVTDPMGPDIVFTSEDVSTTDPDMMKYFDGNTLYWDLKQDVPTPQGKNKVYTTSYTIKLDNTKESFIPYEGEFRPTNGVTSLTYIIYDENGAPIPTDPKKPETSLRTGYFKVPTVKSDRPEAEYTVNYLYKDKETGKYVQGNTETKPAKLWDNVTINSTDFSRENYSYVSGDAGDQKITAKDMTFNLYYDPDTTTVTVNHYYKETVIDADGNETVGEYPQKPDRVVIDGLNDPLYVGDSYEAKTLASGYELDAGLSDEAKIDKLVKTGNEVNFYYYRTVDSRKEATVQVYHIYNEEQWVLENGKYVKTVVEGERQAIGNEVSGKATTTFATSTTGESGYTYVPGSAVITGGSSLIVTEGAASFQLGEGANTITLTFLKSAGDTPDADAAAVEVVHRYTKNVTTVDAEGNIHTDNVAAETFTESVDGYYVGESYTADAWRFEADGDVYSVKPGQNLTIDALKAEGNTIYVDYELISSPATTSVTVQHIYRTYKLITIDEETGESERVLDEQIAEDPVEIGDLYVGQSYAPTINPSERVGFTINAENSENYPSAIVEPGGKTAFVFYYDKDETSDERDEASINVTYTYITHLSTVVEGKPVVIDVTVTPEDYQVTETGLKAGDLFTPEDKPEYNDADYTLMRGSLDAVTLKSGTNATIALVYERDDSDREDADVTVNYYYTDYYMTIVDGKAVYLRDEEPVLDTEHSGPMDGTFYKNQIVELTARPEFDGNTYVPAAGNQSSVTLAAGENTVNLYYTREIPLPRTTVTVEHWYTTDVIGVDGVTTPGTPEKKDGYTVTKELFEGERYTAAARIDDGFTFQAVTVGTDYTQDDSTKDVTLDANGSLTVRFDYHRTQDNSQSASYTVNYFFKTLDWDQNPGDVDYPAVPSQSERFTSFATRTATATPDLKGVYTLDDVTSTPDYVEQDGAYSIVLEAGDGNEINFYAYTRTDTRTDTAVKVVYEYYMRDTHTDTETYSGTSSELISGRSNYAWVGNRFSFTADSSRDWQDRSYALTGDAVQTIDSLAALEEDGSTVNVLTYKYVFEYSSRRDASVTVEHIYQTYDSYTGSTYTSDRTSETYESDGEDDLYVGSIFTAPVADKAGYACQTDAAGRTITLGYNMNLVRVYYLRTISTDPGNYTVNVVHIDGADGAPNQEMLTAQNTSKSYKVGEEYTHAPAANLPEGYKLAHEPEITGESTANGTVTVKYTYVPKDQLTLKVVYNVVALDGQGGVTVVKTLESATTSHLEGFEYNLLPAKEFTGYSYLGLAEGSAAAAGTLTADTTVTLNYEANRYQFRVDFINDYNDTLIETVWNSDMTADFGYTLTNADVSLYLQAPDAEDLSAWQTSRMPSGYHLAGVSYPTMGVSGEGAYSEDGETFDASAVTNVVKVHYDYDYVPPVDPVDPDPSTYHVTVKYLEEGTGKELAKEFSTGELRYNSEYDVSAEAAKSISGYTISSVDGETSGRVRRNLTVTVWYTAVGDGGIDIPDPETPTGDKPELPDGSGEIEITDPETPTGDKPEIPGETGETEIVDGGVPLGDLPQTGTVAKAVEPQWTLGLLALLASMAAAGLAVTVSRKKEEEAE